MCLIVSMFRFSFPDTGGVLNAGSFYNGPFWKTFRGSSGSVKSALTPRIDKGPFQYIWRLTSSIFDETYFLDFNFSGVTNASCAQLAIEVVLNGVVFKTICFPKSASEPHSIHVPAFRSKTKTVVVRHVLRTASLVTTPSFTFHYVGECGLCWLYRVVQGNIQN